MNAFTGFRPAAFTFLRGLRRNNRKEWFEAHRDVYETDVREPMRALVDELDAVLGGIAPEFRGDPKKSVFRIHRDVRFSKDKSPYKTHIACWLFHHDAGHGVGQEAHGGAGFYVHIQPDGMHGRRRHLDAAQARARPHSRPARRGRAQLRQDSDEPCVQETFRIAE